VVSTYLPSAITKDFGFDCTNFLDLAKFQP
jgi:hypothetical protein